MVANPETETGSQPAPFRVSRVFSAPPMRVFQAWSTAEHVRNWFSPRDYEISEARVELRVGGPFEWCMRGPDGIDRWTRGTVVEVVPGERIVLDLYVDDGRGGVLFRAVTEIDLVAVAQGTQMDVVQSYTFTDPAIAAEMVAGAPEGWGQTLDKLETFLAS